MLKFFCLIAMIFAAVNVNSQITPANPVICGNGSVTLSTKNSSPYKWLQSKQGADGAWTVVGTNSSTYSTTEVGWYRVITGTKNPADTSDAVEVKQSEYPVAGFTFSPNNQCGNLPVNFTNTSTGMGLSYLWNFGDGTTATTKDAKHTFDPVGNGTRNFDVELKVTNSSGCTSTRTQVLTVNEVPDATINDFQNEIPFTNCTNDETFTLIITNKSSTTNTNYKIDWGDNSVIYSESTLPNNTKHTYNRQGYFDLILTVTNSKGCISTKKYSVYNGTNPKVTFSNPGSSIGKCIPFTFLVPSLPNDNPPGTIYIFSKNDKTQDDTVKTLPPGYIYAHTFTNSSCGAEGGIIQNTFYIKIRAENQCGKSYLTIEPITTNIKPKADFSVSPKAEICNNTIATFKNLSIDGIEVNNNGKCDYTTKPNWRISPSTGWSIANGKLGDNDPTKDPSTWGTDNLGIQFSIAGSYSISMIVRNSCGNDTITKTICVTDKISPSFTTDKSEGCAPLEVKTTNKTNVTSSCSSATYEWTVTYKSAFCGNTKNWEFTNGTTNSSTSPSFKFINPGIYTITLTATNACGPVSTSKEISVKAPPQVSINPISNSCGPANINPKATISSCVNSTPTFLWTFEGGSPATSANLDPGNVSFSSFGTHSISLAVTNECGTTTANSNIIIDEVPVADAGPTQTLCGSSVKMSANNPPIGKGSWSKISGGIAIITDPFSPNTTITNLTPGKYTFAWTVTNGSCKSTSEVIITILSGASTAYAGTDQNLCLKISTTLNATNPTTGTGVWTQVNGPNSAVFDAPSSPNSTVTGLIPGVYTFKWTVSFGSCTPNTDEVIVTVFEEPTKSNAGKNQTICSTTADLDGNLPVIGKGLWTKVSGPGNPSINSPTTPKTKVTGLQSGTYVFKWTISSGACASSEDDVEIVVTGAITTADAGKDQFLCDVNSTSLSGNTPSIGTGKWSIISGDGAIISNELSPTTTVTGLVPGTYTFQWTISNGICPPSNSLVKIIISEKVTPADAGVDQEVCGTSVQMAANMAISGTGSWTQRSGTPTSIISPSSPTTTISGIAPGKYVFRWTITNGACQDFSEVNITILAGATQANAGKDQNLCKAETITLSGNDPAIGTGTWSLFSGTGAKITDPSLASTGVTGLVPGEYVFRWTINFSNCTPSSDDVIVKIFDNPTNSVAGKDQTICTNTVDLNGNTPVIGEGLWTKVSGPGNPIISSPTLPATTVTDLLAGSYIFKWTISNGNCPPSEDEVSIVVTGAITKADAGEDQILCAENSAFLTGNSPTTGRGKWSIVSGEGAIISSDISSSTSVTGLAPGTYTFRWTISNEICPPSIDEVDITILSDLKNLITSPIATICSGQSVSISGIIATGGTGIYSYQWQQSLDGNSWNNIPGATAINYSTILNSSMYFRREVISLPCTQMSNVVFINVLSAVLNNNISPDQNICINTTSSTILGSIPTGGGGNFDYQWQVSIDGGLTWSLIPLAIDKDYNPGVLVQTTKYRRIVNTSLCNGPQANISPEVTVIVNPNAKAIFSPTIATACPPFVLTSAVMGLQVFAENNKDYNWYANNVFIGSGIDFPGYTISAENSSVDIKLVTTSLFGCKSDSMSAQFYTLNLPHPEFTTSINEGCGPLTVNFKNTTPNITEFTYLWDFGNGQTSTLVNPDPITFLSNFSTYSDTIYVVKLKVFSACDTIVFSKNILVKSKPKALFTPSKTTGCSPMKVLFKNTSKGNNNTYYWDFGDGSTFITNSIDTFTHVFHTGIEATFPVRLKVINDCGEDEIIYKIVTTPNNIKLNFAMNGPDHFGCAPHTVAFINNSKGASSFQWNFGDGNTLSTTKNVDTVFHTYLSDGNYKITLLAENNCTDTSTEDNITVYPKPIPAFTASNYNVCIGQSIQFNNQSEKATSYLWQFGDGKTSTEINPLHSFNEPGIFTVKLITYRTNPSGTICIDSLSQQIQITSTLPGSFTVSDSIKSCAPFTVIFVNKTRPSVISTWDFGDGNIATGDSLSYTFLNAGIFRVTLTVTVPGGCKYISEKTIRVLGPSGDLVFNGGFECIPNSIQFRSNAKNTDTFQWDFGDGSIITTTTNSIYHNYLQAGNYLPTVTLLNNGGCNILLKGTDTIKIDKIEAGFDWKQQKLCGTTTINFTDTSKVFFGKSQIKWLFGDGTSTSGSSANHTYNASGNYRVEMIILGNSGCTDTVVKQLNIHVNNKPFVTLNAESTGCVNQAVLFRGNIISSDSINFSQWKLSNGATGNGAVFSYNFPSAGIYKMQFISGTVNGCFDTSYHSITINPSPFIKAKGSANVCIGNSTQLSVSGSTNYQWSPFEGLSCTTCANPLATPKITTSYIVSTTNNYNCTTSDTVIVTIIPPMKIQKSADVSICIGQSTDLLVSGGANYLWTPAIGLNNANISNPTASPSVTTRYRVVGYDGFNCFTDSAFILVEVGKYPTINLGPDITLSSGTLHPLNSIIENGPITNWLWTPSLDLNCNTCSLPIANIKNDITYTVIATNRFGCSATDTVNIKAFCLNSQVFIPNAFTPDGDGLNDILMVRATGIVTVKYFRIFNRWGELVFEKTNFPPNNPGYGWDGKIRGIAASSSVYVYIAEVVCENGTTYVYKGNTSILK